MTTPSKTAEVEAPANAAKTANSWRFSQHCKNFNATMKRIWADDQLRTQFFFMIPIGLVLAFLSGCLVTRHFSSTIPVPHYYISRHRYIPEELIFGIIAFIIAWYLDPRRVAQMVRTVLFAFTVPIVLAVLIIAAYAFLPQEAAERLQHVWDLVWNYFHPYLA